MKWTKKEGGREEGNLERDRKGKEKQEGRGLREKTLQSSRSASSCRCLGSCKTKRPSVTGDWEHSRTARGARARSPGGGPRGLSAHLPRRSAAHSRCVVSAE